MGIAFAIGITEAPSAPSREKPILLRVFASLREPT